MTARLTKERLQTIRKTVGDLDRLGSYGAAAARELLAEVEALAAERDRYREALKCIAADDTLLIEDFETIGTITHSERAKLALAADTKKGEGQ